AADSSGDVFVIDHSNNYIKEVLPGGSINYIPTGIVEMRGIAVDGAGNLFVSDYYYGTIQKIPYNTSTHTYGSIQSIASGFNSPWGVAVDAAGDVFVGEQGTG